MSPPSLCAAACSTPLRAAPPPLLRFRRPASSSVSVSASRAAAPSVSDDLVLRIAEQLEDSAAAAPLLGPLRAASALSLLSTPWPTRRANEAFRFTDVSYLRSLPISLPAHTPSLAPPPSPDAESHIIFSDGLLVSASGAHVAALADMPPGVARDRAAAAVAASAQFSHRDVFYDFNAVGASDVAVVYVPEGRKMGDDPVHIVFGYSGSEDGASMMMSNPRVLVIAEKGAEVAIVEEHFGTGEGCYWANPVVDIIVEEGARVVHSYVQRQSSAAAHTKWTTVQQVRLSRAFRFI
jgi:Fe-S cluster assembly protein SufD